MSRTRTLVGTALLAGAFGLLPRAAFGQCATNDDCRYGRVCVDGRCSYPEGGCQRDVDCPEGAVCEEGRCAVAAPAPAPAPAEILPPPRPMAARVLKRVRTDGGARFTDPLDWGGRGALSPRPRGTTVLDFQYGSGDVPCPCGVTECPGDQTSINSLQVTLGGDSVIADILDIGFVMALFKWDDAEGCGSDYAIGDVQMRVSALAYRRQGERSWLGITPFMRLLVSSGWGGLRTLGLYQAMLEGGLAVGYAWGILSIAGNVSGLVSFGEDETTGMFLSHLSIAVRPHRLVGILADLEVGYGLPGEQGAVPAAVLLGVRLYAAQVLVLDLGSRIAMTEEARYSDFNAAAGLWSIGLRASVVWRGMGRE